MIIPLSSLPRPVWARPEEVRRLTGCPEKWLVQFGKGHPESTRKFGEGAANGTLVYKLDDVLASIETEVRHA